MDRDHAQDNLVKTGSEVKWRHTITWNFGAKDYNHLYIYVKDFCILQIYSMIAHVRNDNHAYILTKYITTKFCTLRHYFQQKRIAHGLHRHGSDVRLHNHGIQRANRHPCKFNTTMTVSYIQNSLTSLFVCVFMIVFPFWLAHFGRSRHVFRSFNAKGQITHAHEKHARQLSFDPDQKYV